MLYEEDSKINTIIENPDFFFHIIYVCSPKYKIGLPDQKKINDHIVHEK